MAVWTWRCAELALEKTPRRVTIISRNLTLENFNSGERQSRNFDILPPSPYHFSSAADQGGPPGVAKAAFLHDSGGPVVMQQAPRCNAVRALRQKENEQKVAHFRRFRRNALSLRRQKMHAQNSRICGQMILIFEFFKDFEAFVGIILSF